jgi:histidyl-tRNA synthetase
MSLALLRAILDSAWQNEIFPVLKALFIEGEFYKDDNRAEFSEAYTTLSKLIDRVDGFRTRVSMQGDLGRALHDLEHEQLGRPEKRRQRQEIIAQVDEHAESLVKSALSSFASLTKILNGVLYGEVGGRYDTLSNIRDIGGRHNRSFLASLERAMQLCQSALDVVSQLFDLERAQTQAGTYNPISGRA